MAWKISWHLSCDQCKKTATFSGQPSMAVAKKAKRYGWNLTPDFQHYCPACAKAKSREDAIAAAAAKPETVRVIGSVPGWSND